VSERYEKQGVSVRLESTARGTSVIALREGGWSLVKRGEFSCGPLPLDQKGLTQGSTATTASINETIRRIARGRSDIERITIVEGRARHVLSAGSTRHLWHERSARIFVTLVRKTGGRRSALALGADSLNRLDLGPLETVCQAFALHEGAAPQESEALTLEPWVTASLLRALADKRCELAGGLRLVQRSPSTARDGRGRKPRRRIVRHSPALWPDCFRPSYRFAPSFTPLHVDLVGAGAVGREPAVRLVGLESEWVLRAEGLVARVWAIEQATNRIIRGEIVVDPLAMSRSSVHASGEPLWYPAGAGAWGRRLTLGQQAARLRSP
jgi:hypothetical protein